MNMNEKLWKEFLKIKSPARPPTMRDMILEAYEETLREAADDLFLQLRTAISPVKDKLNIDSYIKTSPSEFYVRFKTKTDRRENREDFKKVLSDSGFEMEDKRLSSHSVPVTYIRDPRNPEFGTIKVVYKYSTKTRVGLAFEHILALMFDNKITDKIKKRLDLPPSATDEEVLEILRNEQWAPFVERARKLKEVLQGKFDNISSVAVEGGGGGKADLVLTLDTGDKVGVSLKLGIETDNAFIYNKDLGNGIDKPAGLPANLIPSGTDPWWMVGRKRFFESLKQARVIPPDTTYEPSSTDYSPPEWMEQAKIKQPRLYKEAVSFVFSNIRNILFKSLRSLDLENLADVVSEAHYGKASPNVKVMPLYKLSSSPTGVKLEEVPRPVPNHVEIEDKNMTVADMVKRSQVKSRDGGTVPGSRIIIDIPGMPEAVINSVKFRSNMMAHKKGDLNIKTR